MDKQSEAQHIFMLCQHDSTTLRMIIEEYLRGRESIELLHRSYKEIAYELKYTLMHLRADIEALKARMPDPKSALPENPGGAY